MARPPQPGDPPHGSQPHLIPPEELVAQVGTCSLRLLGTRPRVESPPAPELHLGPFTWQTRPEDVSPDDKLLGIYVYTPYYKTATAALKSHGAASTAQVCEVVPDRVPHVPVGLFDAVVPLRPQRFPEFPAFLHLPSIIKHQGPEGHAGIVLDLTRVGGRYFATVFAKAA